jgi:two-component system chemotaxis response regulator CheB
VLVVDDAVVVRRMLTDVLSAEPDIEVSGVAANGRIALQKMAQATPDVVTLDVEMPELDGLATLKELRKTWPKLPVIMFSTLTERGAAATLDALTLGASDYVTKPANVGSVMEALSRIRQELVPKVRSLAGAGLGHGTGSSASNGNGAAPSPTPAGLRPGAGAGTTAFKPGSAPGSTPASGATTGGLGKPVFTPSRVVGVEAIPGTVEIVAIGVSTGGPNALAAMLPSLPAELPVPVVIVQHMPPMFTRLLAERLNTQAKLSVVEAQAGMTLKPGVVYIAPGDYHMELKRNGLSTVIALHQGPPENSCRPAVDVLFRSVAKIYGARAVGVVLTGMGQDGLRGSEFICDAGGRVIAQDEPSSVVWGMPGFVVRAGLADKVMPLETIAAEIVRRTTPIAPGARV